MENRYTTGFISNARDRAGRMKETEKLEKALHDKPGSVGSAIVFMLLKGLVVWRLIFLAVIASAGRSSSSINKPKNDTSLHYG